MFKTEIEVSGNYISGQIKLSKNATEPYMFYPGHFHFTSQSSFNETELNGIQSEINKIKDKINELNKPLVVTRSFIPGQRD